MSERGGFSAETYELGELISIATAITDRGILETQKDQQRTGMLVGEPLPQPPEELAQVIRIAGIATVLREIEGTDEPLTFEDAIRSVIGATKSTLAEMAPSVSADQIEASLAGIGKVIAEDVVAANAAAFGSLKENLSLAEQLSQEEGITVSAVFADDATYYKFVRRVTTVEQFAAKTLDTIDAMGPQTMNKLAMHIITLQLAAEEEGLTDDDIAKAALEIQLDPEFQRFVQTETKKIQEVQRTVATMRMCEIWGTPAVRSLPDAIRERLIAARQPDAPTIIGELAIYGASDKTARTLQARQEFVRQYFAERGWDADDPTMEQIAQVRAEPGWQNPLGL